jgi:hypothetical protein
LAPWIFLGIGGVVWAAVTSGRGKVNATSNEHAKDIAELLQEKSK